MLLSSQYDLSPEVSVRKGVLRNFAKFTGTQVCQSASVSTNELLHVYMLSKLSTFMQGKLSFSYFRQVNLRKSFQKMVKQNPMINIGLKMSRYLCCQLLYQSLSLVVIRCTTRFHSLSLVVPLIVTCCHSVSLVVPFAVTLCNSLSLVVTRCTTQCHSLSFVVTRYPTRCHSLSFVVTRCTNRLSFYKRSQLGALVL